MALVTLLVTGMLYFNKSLFCLLTWRRGCRITSVYGLRELYTELGCLINLLAFVLLVKISYHLSNNFAKGILTHTFSYKPAQPFLELRCGYY